MNEFLTDDIIQYNLHTSTQQQLIRIWSIIDRMTKLRHLQEIVPGLKERFEPFDVGYTIDSDKLIHRLRKLLEFEVGAIEQRTEKLKMLYENSTSPCASADNGNNDNVFTPLVYSSDKVYSYVVKASEILGTGDAYDTLDYEKIIRDFLNWCEAHKYWEEENNENYNQCQKELGAYIQLIVAYFSNVADLNFKAQRMVSDKWRCLTDLSEDGIHDKFNLIVSVGKADWHTKRSNIISASYITERFPTTYLSDENNFGWCFSMDADSLIGMCPEDMNSVTLNYSSALGTGSIWNALAGAFFTGDGRYFHTPYPDFLKWYSPEAMLFPNKVNEIVFDAVGSGSGSGRCKPTGVIVKCYGVDNLSNTKLLEQNSDFCKASTIASLYKLPLVVFAPALNKIRVITRPTSISWV